MTQAAEFGAPVQGPKAPAAVTNQIDQSLKSLMTGHLGSSRPAYLEEFGMWTRQVNGTTAEIYVYAGGQDVLVATIDANGHDIEFAGVSAQLASVSADVATKAPASHSHSFTSLTGRPTTISGYGITDGVRTNADQTISSHKTFADGKRVRIGSGNDLDIYHSNGYSLLEVRTGTFEIRGNVAGGDLNFTATRADGTRTMLIHCANGQYVDLRYQGSVKFRTESWGGTCYGEINISSDAKLKKDIAPIEGSLDTVLGMNGVYYVRKDDPTEKRLVGFVANEVEEVLPEVVREDAEGLKTVSYPSVTAVLVEAIKELEGRVRELEGLEPRGQKKSALSRFFSKLGLKDSN
ncbi:MAG: tail fiber domain-containing protein [Roseibium sp.]|nr:tail fiber domain-containing protein [Roseibium sp.]